MTLVVAVATVLLEQAAAALRQGQHAFASVERYALHQPLVLQVPVAVVARIERLVARIAEVALRNNPKCSNGRQCAAVLAIELIGAIALVKHDLALQAARQVEAFDERISWVPVTISVPLAPVFVPLARVVVPPSVAHAVVVARVVVTVTWIEAVEHTRLLPETDRHVQQESVAWRWSSGYARGTAAGSRLRRS